MSRSRLTKPLSGFASDCAWASPVASHNTTHKTPYQVMIGFMSSYPSDLLKIRYTGLDAASVGIVALNRTPGYSVSPDG
jgi:hypothetical protein